MENRRVLVVDDDPLLRERLSVVLSRHDYWPASVATGEAALQMVAGNPPDLILLDMGLPGMAGLDVLRALSRVAPRVPIISLTPQCREPEEILGLELGADDYITKPFAMDLLLAHIRAVLRRARQAPEGGEDEGDLRLGDLWISPAQRRARIGDRDLDLAPKEFALLLTLARRPGHIFSVNELLNLIWGAGWIGEPQTVYVHVRWLRQKIEEDPGHPSRLVTVRGGGYRLTAL